jgi:hypothetical protein
VSRIVLIELRRSPLRWWLPFLLFVDIAMLFGRSTEWIGVWPQASAAAQVPVLYVAMLLSAGAAWAAGRIQRVGSAEVFEAAALPVWRREAALLTSTVIYGLVPIAVGAVVAAAVSFRRAGPGFLWPSYLVLAAILVVISAAVGHLLGRLISNRSVAPLLAPVVIFLLIGFRAFPWLELSVLSGPPQLKVEPPALAVRAVLAATVVLVALLVNPRRNVGSPRQRTRRLVAVAAASVIGTVAATAGVAMAGPLRTERQPPAHPLCSDTVPRVCVWPEQRVHLPAMVAAAQRLGALKDAVIVPDTFYEEGLRGPIGTISDFALVLGDYAAVRGMASAIMDDTLGVMSCQPSTGEIQERNTKAWIELKEWIVARGYGPKPSDVHGGFEFDEAEIARVTALPATEQAEWARGRLTVVRETRCA